MVEFRLLGSVEALEDGRALPIGGRQQRAVLAILLLHANDVVSIDRLIDAIWGDAPPPTAATTVQVYVSRLRKLLGKNVLETRGSGYRLRIDPDCVDLIRAEKLVARARHADDPAERAGLLREALRLWRGAPFGDLAYERFAQLETERLEEERLLAVEARIEAELALGASAEVIAELQQLTADHPLRETVRAQLMLAYYRAGRQADALAVYQDARRMLVDELGLEPGDRLQRLERQILNHDPALGVQSADPTAPPPVRFPAAPREERKLVTVLFADLVGFTRRAEELDPEDVRLLLRRFHQPIRRELERFGGTVEKYVGDAVMAVFGAPAAHEDDAERAVRAAFALMRAVKELRVDDVRLDFDVRVGINTGYALVTLDAAIALGEGMVAGDIVNTAARLQAGASVDGIVVGRSTYLATKHAVEYLSLEPLAAKGKAATLEAWQAVHELTRIGERQAAPRRSRLVGRAGELETLCSVLADPRRARAGRVVTVIGAPGIGKTRLVTELRAVAPAELTWLVGRSLSYGNGVPFYALAEIVRGQIGTVASDDATTLREKLERAVDGLLAEDVQWVLSHLGLLVGLESDRTGARSEAFAAWRRYFEALATASPVVLLLEDVHWADDGLLDFIEHLRAWTRAPLAVVCTARPELRDRRPTWDTLQLAPLADDDCGELVDELLELEPADRQAVIHRVGGNPLFVEEFARAFETHGRAAAFELPGTVQATIAARLDLLPLAEKAVVSNASVLGRAFSVDALAAVTDPAEPDLLARLEALEQRQVIRRETGENDAEYAFAHVLVRDVAYEQLPRGERAQRHERAAEWLESTADRLEERAELIAYHFVSALDLFRALDSASADLVERTAWSLWRAGDRARQLYANDEAVVYLKQGIELLEDISAPRELAAPLHETLGDVLELQAKHLDGDGELERARELTPREEHVLVARLLRKQAASRQLQRRIAEAREAFDAADAALGDEPLGAPWWSERCEIAIQRLQLLYFAGALDEFKAAALAAEPLVEQHGDVTQRSALHSWLGMLLMRRERFAPSLDALAHLHRAVASARDEVNLDRFLWFQFLLGFAYLWARRFDEAEVELAGALALAERIGDATNRTRILNYQGVLARWRGQVERAHSLAAETLEAAEATQMAEYVVQARAAQAWVKLRDGDLDSAHRLATTVAEEWDEYFQQRVLAWMPRGPLLGVALERDDAAEAAEHARVMLDPTRQPLPNDVAHPLAAAVRAVAAGDPVAARSCFARAAEPARAYGYL